MQRTRTFLFTLASLVPTTALAAAPIVNGTPTTGSPAVLMLDIDGGGVCTATLVSKHVLLTAKHCLQNAKIVSVLLQSGFGEYASHFTTHPDGDIGLVTLAKEAGIEPVPIFTSDLAAHVGEDVHIVGFGVTSETGTDSGEKREGHTKLHHVTATEMITGYEGSSTCYGDSGGPNFMTIDGKEVIVGVTSGGSGECGQPENFAVRADAYKDWIEAYVKLHEAGGACAADDKCNFDCPDAASADPDCRGCGYGDECRSDCPHLDFDCCASDGMCHEACGIADEDCPRSAPDAGPEAPAQGEGGGCSVGGHAGARGAALLLALLLFVSARVGRRGSSSLRGRYRG
jgi:V8-like Glu-specific endopeptidase